MTILDNKMCLWWEKEDEEMFDYVCQMVKHISSLDTSRRDMNLRCAKLYSNTFVANLTPQGYYHNTVESVSFTNRRKMGLNIVSNMVDTVTSKMAKIRPKVSFLTEDGDYILQSKAKKLEKFVSGQFYLAKLSEKVNKCVQDSLIFDTGVLKIAADRKNIITERVLPDELKVEPEDAAYGDPSHIYHIKYYRKSQLKNKFPKFAQQIDEAVNTITEYQYSSLYANDNDLILVIEAWHKSSGKKAKDGKHIIAISNATLFVEDWNKDRFPFLFSRWSDRLIGFFGQSLTERLLDIQYEINKILRDIQQSMNLFSVPFIALEMGSKINRTQLNNQIAHLVDYINTPPQFVTPPIEHPQWFEHLERLIRQAYEVAGISQLSASSRKPAGLDAAVALREYQDIESERFLSFGTRVEDLFLQAAELFIEAAKDIGGDFEVKAQSKKFIQKIKWSEIDLDDSVYSMKLYPASILPETPAGRLQFVLEMLNMGLIPKDEALSLLDYPDTEAVTSLLTAATEDIHATISNIIEKGEYQPPEPAQNLKLGIQLVNAAYLKAKNNQVPEDTLDLLRQWVEDASSLLGLNPITKAPAQEAPIAPPELSAPSAIAPMPESSPAVIAPLTPPTAGV